VGLGCIEPQRWVKHGSSKQRVTISISAAHRPLDAETGDEHKHAVAAHINDHALDLTSTKIGMSTYDMSSTRFDKHHRLLQEVKRLEYLVGLRLSILGLPARPSAQPQVLNNNPTDSWS
jgi:hypothetical protein